MGDIIVASQVLMLACELYLSFSGEHTTCAICSAATKMQHCTFARCSFLVRSGTLRAMDETAWWARGWLGASSLSSASPPERSTAPQ